MFLNLIWFSCYPFSFCKGSVDGLGRHYPGVEVKWSKVREQLESPFLQGDGGQKTFTEGFQVALIRACPFRGLRTPDPKIVLPLEERQLICPLRVPRRNPSHHQSEPTYIHGTTFSESSGKNKKKVVCEFGSWFWTLMSTHKPLGMLYPMGTPSAQLLMFPLGTTRVCSLPGPPANLSLDV